MPWASTSSCRPTAGDGSTFRHALVREALYAELLPGEREDLHRAVLEALGQRRGGAARPSSPTTISRPASGRRRCRLDRGRPATTPVRAAYPEALQHFERALELWDVVEPADPPLDRLGVYREAAEAARLTGEYDRAVEHCRRRCSGSTSSRIPSAPPASSSA